MRFFRHIEQYTGKSEKKAILRKLLSFSENIPPRGTVPFEFSPELPKIPVAHFAKKKKSFTVELDFEKEVSHTTALSAILRL